MDYTDRHCRYLHRLTSRHVRLYTEMVTARALIHGDSARLLRFHSSEHPVALQLGGATPDELARAAKLGAKHGYDEINLNVGCPSDRVQSGRFGACLMAEPELVKDCVVAMSERVRVPITVKTRIGIDDQDDYPFLVRFTEQVVAAGIETLIVHARKAWLTGLSPKQNRTVPPLDYARVIRLKQEFPSLKVIINGGIERIEAIRDFLNVVDGVMLGRKAYHDPYLLAQLDQQLHGVQPPSREDIIHSYLEYAVTELEQGTSASVLMRPALGLYAGQPGARNWRRALGELAARKPAPEQLRETIIALLSRQATAA